MLYYQYIYIELLLREKMLPFHPRGEQFFSPGECQKSIWNDKPFHPNHFLKTQYSALVPAVGGQQAFGKLYGELLFAIHINDFRPKSFYLYMKIIFIT